MCKDLHIDVETYSEEDIRTVGAYKYVESDSFEILLIAYAFGSGPKKIVDLAQGEEIPIELERALKDPDIRKHAHNAVFERLCFDKYGFKTQIKEWYCSAIKAAYCGLPLSLEMVSKALNLGENGKLSTGKALIRYFCIPCKPTKTNGQRTRNLPHHDLEKWEDFKNYCLGDVEAERTIGFLLKDYEIPRFERLNYILDQEINDRGILIDLDMAKNAFLLNQTHAKTLLDRMKELTGLENPNSPVQLKNWLNEALSKELEKEENKTITSLNKQEMPRLFKLAGSGPVREVLKLRQKSSKTSIKKYIAMLKCACADKRARGLFQFYGANRTGRWAGRLIQLQNLPQNLLNDLELAREVFAAGDYELAKMLYDNVSSTLSQLIRTAFIAKFGFTFAVADFSAIEARVIAWLANETWRLEVFKTHGKIYEASAAMMFGVSIDEVTKGSEYRAKGKIAELALGYQGAVGALKTMGGEKMGLSELEMVEIVEKWRDKNPEIVKLWWAVNNAAIRTIKTRKKTVLSAYKNLTFECDGKVLTIQLPSGRKLFYQEPRLVKNKWGKPSVQYRGVEQMTKRWWWIPSYGGKFTENIVQAIARDLLAYSMLKLNKEGFKIVMHVHDEAAVEIPILKAEKKLDQMCEIMGQEIPWAKGLPLAADGYITPFYKKD